MNVGERRDPGHDTVQASRQQTRPNESKDMTAAHQQRHVVLLDELPPEILREIIDFCADDICIGRTTLLSLSLMNKYLRSVSASRLFERVCFRDGPESPGDEIFHSIRKFNAAPELGCHARTASLYLNRLDCPQRHLGTPPEPYHYLVLPEFVQALIKMPGVTELYFHMDHELGRNCMRGLQAAMHWCSAGRELNITSLTLETDVCQVSTCACGEPSYDVDFFGAFPQLKAFCFEGLHRFDPLAPLMLLNRSYQPIASNLTQLRIYKTCSDPRSLLSDDAWRDEDFSELRLGTVMPQVEYLSILGELRGFPVSRILSQLKELAMLKYLDITDEQVMHRFHERMLLIRAFSPRQRSDHHQNIKDLARNHTLNEDRSEMATNAFNRSARLRRICFVRSCVGEVYLRGYPDAVADSTGYVSSDLKDADLIEIPERWHHGVPQTGLLPFPTFTPWEGLQGAT